jgi:hypothetical protein
VIPFIVGSGSLVQGTDALGTGLAAR